MATKSVAKPKTSDVLQDVSARLCGVRGILNVVADQLVSSDEVDAIYGALDVLMSAKADLDKEVCCLLQPTGDERGAKH